MIALWLLVAHLVGDYLLATRWQATGKFGWTWKAVALRYRHCCGYVLPFVIVALCCTGASHHKAWDVIGFSVWLFLLHFITDAQRFTSTLGDVIGWQLQRRSKHARVRMPLLPAPNPWPPIGLAIDQTLHLIQIAVLAQVFLT